MKRIVTSSYSVACYSVGMLVVGFLAIAGLAATAHAQADAVYEQTHTIIDTPDNHCPAWARDTIDRATTIVDNGDGTLTVTAADSGTWVSADGLDGTITGTLEWAPITGTLKAQPVDVGQLDMSEFDCKSDAPAELGTTRWPLRFVDTEQTPVLTFWEWTYDTDCESFTENATTEAVGADKFTGEECPEPSEEPSSTPSQSPSSTPSTTPSTTPILTPASTPSVAPAAATLPNTGTGNETAVLVLLAVVLLASGAATLIGTRRMQRR